MGHLQDRPTICKVARRGIVRNSDRDPAADLTVEVTVAVHSPGGAFQNARLWIFPVTENPWQSCRPKPFRQPITKEFFRGPFERRKSNFRK